MRGGKIFTSTAAAALVSTAMLSGAQDTMKEILRLDYASAKDAVEHNGQKAKLLDANAPNAEIGRVDTSGLGINENSMFTVEVEIAGEKVEPFHIRVVPFLDKKQRLDSVRGGITEQSLTPEFKTHKGTFAISDDPNYFSEKEREINSLLISVYRGKPEGQVWVKSFKMSTGSVTPLATANLLAELKKELLSAGYTLAEKDQLLTANKADERKYYSLNLSKSYPSKEAFMRAAGLGTTYLRCGFTQPLFPVGPYIYGNPDEMRKRAEKRSLTLEGLFEAHAKDVADHGGNTIYYANLTKDTEVFKKAVDASVKNGVYVFGQLTTDLYLRVQKGRDYYEQVTIPAATKILPLYRGLKGVLGWMGCEEANTKAMPLVIEYRKLCRELDPTHGLFTLHNHLSPFQADTDAYPEWYGFDRYRFRCVSPEIVISTPREMVSLLSRELSGCYVEAEKRGRPLIYVGQSYGHLNEIKADKMERRSGFREVSPGIWQGWLRYTPPEHGMCLQSWLAVTEGARGLLWYHYNSREDQRKDSSGIIKEDALIDTMGKEKPIWKELGDCVKGMKPLFPLFISWHKEGIARGKTDNSWIKHSSFIREFDKERYYVLLNTRIAEWDKDSPMRPSNDTALYFDEHGLAGLRKVGPLTFKFRTEGNDRLWNVLTGELLAAGADNQYELTIAPGNGLVLAQGTENDVKAARASLNLK